MKSSRSVYIIYFAFCGLITLYFFMSQGSPESVNAAANKNDSSEDSSRSGGFSSNNQNSGDGQSVFDMAFFTTDRPDKPIEEVKPGSKDNDEPDILETVDKDNPINPQTRQPFTNRAMKQFDSLRKKFPNNSL